MQNMWSLVNSWVIRVIERVGFKNSGSRVKHLGVGNDPEMQ